MDEEFLQRALNAEYQAANIALAMAESECLLAKWTGDAQGYQAAKGRKSAARSRLQQCKKVLAKTQTCC